MVHIRSEGRATVPVDFLDKLALTLSCREVKSRLLDLLLLRASGWKRSAVFSKDDEDEEGSSSSVVEEEEEKPRLVDDEDDSDCCQNDEEQPNETADSTGIQIKQ